MPRADTSLRLDWNWETGTQTGCDWPHARHTVVLYHPVCSFLQKCSFLWIYQRKWYCLSSSTLLSLKGSSLEVFARVGRNFWYTKHCSRILIFSMVTESFQEYYLDIDLSSSTHVISLKLFQCDIDGYATLCGKSLNEASQQSKFKTLQKLTVIRTGLDNVNLFRFYKVWRTWSI